MSAKAKKQKGLGEIFLRFIILGVLSAALVYMGGTRYKDISGDAKCKIEVEGKVSSVHTTTETRHASNHTYTQTVYEASVSYTVDNKSYQTTLKSDDKDTYTKGKKVQLAYEEGNPEHCVSKSSAENKTGLYLTLGMMGAGAVVFLIDLIVLFVALGKRSKAKKSEQSAE